MTVNWSMTTLRIIAIVVAVALIVGLFAETQCSRTQTAKTQATLATGQADAAIQSGADAANMIGNRMDADAATDTITRGNADAIRNAQGADAPVAAPVRDAGLAGLCRRAAYLRDPKCVQHHDPR